MLAIPATRLAAPALAPRIAEMSRDTIEFGLGWSWTMARVLRAIQDSSTNVAVVVQHNQLQGFGIMQYGDDDAHLVLLAVRPAMRHRGIGRRLTCWLERSAQVAGIARVRLEARADNHNAIAFYQHLGYRRCSTAKGYYEGRIDAVRLEKALLGA